MIYVTHILRNENYGIFLPKDSFYHQINGDMLPQVKENYRSRCRFKGNYIGMPGHTGVQILWAAVEWTSLKSRIIN